MWKNQLEYWFQKNKYRLGIIAVVVICFLVFTIAILFSLTRKDHYDSEEGLLSAVYDFDSNHSLEIKKVEDSFGLYQDGKFVENVEPSVTSECLAFSLDSKSSVTLSEKSTGIEGVYSLSYQEALGYLSSRNLKKVFLVLKPDYFEFYYREEGSLHRFLYTPNYSVLGSVAKDFSFKSLNSYLEETIS